VSARKKAHANSTGDNKLVVTSNTRHRGNVCVKSVGSDEWKRLDYAERSSCDTPPP
jgi:hypothetical protein